MTTWIAESDVTSDDLEAHVAALSDGLKAVASVAAVNSIEVSLVVMVQAQPMGFMFDVSAETLEQLASSRCQVVFDVYNDEAEGR